MGHLALTYAWRYAFTSLSAGHLLFPIREVHPLLFRCLDDMLENKFDILVFHFFFDSTQNIIAIPDARLFSIPSQCFYHSFAVTSYYCLSFVYIVLFAKHPVVIITSSEKNILLLVVLVVVLVIIVVELVR